MAFKVELVTDKKYLSLVLTGSLSRSDYELSSHALSSGLKENGWNKILIDATQSRSGISLGEDFEFVSDLPSRFGLGVRVAILFAPEETEKLQFVKDVARNRGLDMMLFKDKVEAVNWLINA